MKSIYTAFLYPLLDTTDGSTAMNQLCHRKKLLAVSFAHFIINNTHVIDTFRV